ncbi:receptor-type tyrosine-protein phosphatase T-like [Mytilus californianus]|uniref:receptor-type tyrosine-protein phosphatase T-like n=1 Tax=Mytilus californianus TaxID=6549 RepID=UPI0022484122|nr:receptor-type tyrosine-protein phosphatase T-like [Mytilus californianus]
MLLVLLIHTTMLLTVSAQKNLAPLGKATQSSQSGIAGPYNAIHSPVSNKWSDRYCTHTNTDFKSPAWWMFNSSFESTFITDVTIYYRENLAYRMDGFKLYVTNISTIPPDGYLCYEDTDQDFPNITQTIPCNKLGKYVIYYDAKGSMAEDKQGPIVELCYVAINGCQASFWGSNCQDNCAEKCIERNCFPGNGSCVWGCNPKNCLNDICNKDTAVCTEGCNERRRTGSYCDMYNIAYDGLVWQSPSGSQQADLANDGNKTSCSKTIGSSVAFHVELKGKSIVTGIYIILGDGTTKEDHHTFYASNESNAMNSGTVLYNGTFLPTEINFEAVFKFLTYVPPVQIPFTELELCEIGIIGCPPTHYGPLCNTTCPQNCNGPCDLDVGHCIFGCLNGWTGTTCEQECPVGSYGNDCFEKCSANCWNPKCDHVTGECISGCNAGWRGFNCSQNCPSGQFGGNCSGFCDGCLSSMCDHVGGICDITTSCKRGYIYSEYCDVSCDDGNFGRNCEKTCNCLTEPCSKGDGICPPGGCKEGWHGESCNKECNSGYFGRNCDHFCDGCISYICDKTDGLCKNTSGCEPGYLYEEYCNRTCDDEYFGKNCTRKCNCLTGTCNIFTGTCEDASKSTSEKTNVIAIVGGAAAILVLVLIVTVAFIVYKRRLVSKQDRYIQHTKPRIQTTLNAQKETSNEYANVNVVAITDAEEVIFTLKDREFEDPDLQTDENGDENVYYNDTSEHDVSKYKILIKDLKWAINEKQKADGFKNEYEILPRGLMYAHVEGSKEENKVKNRFLSTWPYDHSRVILKGNTKQEYINASYIDNYEHKKAYIAAQGPKRITVKDFLHMIWQENVEKIVMVTQLIENEKKKCESYWPESVSEPLVVNNFKVTMTEERKYTFYVYRLLTLSLKNVTNVEERKIHHFHFIQWPDHGVPDSIKLVDFYRKVKNEKCHQSGPMVVHCSAGIGRTGTFIAIDELYQHGTKIGYVNVMEYIEMMRKDRMNMVQTYEQYETVFEALLELFTVPKTSIPKNDFCHYILDQENKTSPRNQKLYKVEFQRLKTLRPLYPPSAFTAATLKENISKNSAKKILAHDRYRPYLMSYGKTRSDYINAVIIPGYADKSKFLVTQCPLEGTVVDFWTMVYDHDSKVVVLLDQLNKNGQLWTGKNEVLEFEHFTILQENASNTEQLQLTLHSKKKEQRKITVFTAPKLNVTSDAMLQTSILLDLLKNVKDFWEEHKGYITVVSSDGCTKIGLFVALYLSLEKMEKDDEIDVFQVVRAMQVRRPEFLMELEQYEYCYRCIKEYLERDSLYANV